MTRDERIAICEICKKRKMDWDRGLLCGLTDEYATFDVSCKDFENDEKEEEKVFVKKLAATGDYETGDPVDFKKNKEQGIWFILSGALALLIMISNDSTYGLSKLAYVPIIYGSFLYYRGTEQEKLIKDRAKRDEQHS